MEIVPLGVCRIGTEYLGNLVCEGKGKNTKKIGSVNIYASKIIFNSKVGYFRGPFPPHFKGQYMK